MQTISSVITEPCFVDCHAFYGSPVNFTGIVRNRALNGLAFAQRLNHPLWRQCRIGFVALDISPGEINFDNFAMIAEVNLEIASCAGAEKGGSIHCSAKTDCARLGIGDGYRFHEVHYFGIEGDQRWIVTILFLLDVSEADAKCRQKLPRQFQRLPFVWNTLDQVGGTVLNHSLIINGT